MARSSFLLALLVGLSLFGPAVHSAAADAPPVIGAVKARSLSKTGARYPLGSMVRLYAVETSGESDVAGGTVRITSASLGYDSGIKALYVPSDAASAAQEEDRHYFHWDTAGLAPGSDYRVSVSLTDQAGHTASDSSLSLTLVPRPPVTAHLVGSTDLVVPARGMPVVIARSYVVDSGYNGPLGFKWSHSYLMHLEEATDGLVKVFNADGSGSFFKPLPGGGYRSPRGDFRTLTKGPDGSFSLRTTAGTVFELDQGRLTRIRDRHGNTTVLAHGPEARLETITDPSGRATAFFYDSLGRLVRIADPAGRQVLYGYDARGNLSSFTDPAGARTAYSYDQLHHLTRVLAPGNRATFFAVDAQERLVSVQKAGGIDRRTYQYADAVPEVIVTDALGKQSRIGYASAGPPTRIIDPLGSVEHKTYDADFNLLSTTDANGRTTSFTYDGQGNVLEWKDALGRRTVFTYEPMFSQMTGMTTASGSHAAFSYDDLGNLRTVTYPDGSTEELSYDAFGQVATKTDRLGRTIAYTYDERGLLTAKLYPDGTSATYDYDPRGNLIEAVNDSGTVAAAWDSADRLAGLTYAGGETAAFTYGPSGDLASFTSPDGTVLQYGRDGAGRVTAIREASGRTLAAYLYDAAGRVLRKTLGNGTFAVSTYDAAGRLLTLVNKRANGSTISRFAYAYDKKGNRKSVTTLAGTTAYTYDALDQLTKVVLPNRSTAAYDFDANGNRRAVTLNRKVIRYVANALDQYTRIGSDTYAYDRNGNLIRKTTAAGIWTYTYDFEDRLTSVKSPVETVTYTYDALGRRVGRSCKHGSTTYFNALGQVVLAVDQSGAETAYAYGPGLDELLAIRRTDGEAFVSLDGLRSVTDLTNAAGSVVGSVSYDAYGAATVSGKVSSPYLFTGREYDADAGLYHYRARYYDPKTGRFTTPDPIGLAGGVNRYTYVGNNPVNRVDPLGLAPVGLPLPAPPLSGDSFSISPPSQAAGPPIPPPDYQSNDDGIMDPPPGGSSVSSGDPTFIQVDPTGPAQVRAARDPEECLRGAARIAVPPDGALVRGQVPVFGVACGRGFRSYRVELGAGREPKEWTLVAGSTTAREKDEIEALYADPSGDITIHGNLATWDTGLRSYVYLPAYPADHPVDLKGVYTLRLVVTLDDGRTVEDRVAVEVGEAIPNAWGATVTSADGKVKLTVPEHALTDSFRVVSIKPGDAPASHLPRGVRPLGHLYELRQPGERFTRPVTLTMPAPTPAAAHQVAVYTANHPGGPWRRLPSRRATETSVAAELTEMERYCVVGSGESVPPQAVPTKSSAVDVVQGPFDAREFPLVDFRYRIGPGIKTDFFVKVEGRWYHVGLTGDPQEWDYRRVNVAGIGRIPGIVADDRWHTASFNLYEMLRTKTARHLVDEVVTANWEVGGFMKLAPGADPKGAYSIDGFAVRRDDRSAQTPAEPASWVFTGASGTAQLASAPGGPGEGQLLGFTFDVSPPGAWAGYATPLNLDARGHGALTFAVRPATAGQDLRIGLRDRRGRERKVRVSELSGRRLAPGWQTVTLPLAAFGEEVSLAQLDNVSFAVENGFSTAGSLLLSRPTFGVPPRLVVDTFDRKEPFNLLAGAHRTFATGEAAVSGTVAEADGNRFYRLSYGGNIGETLPYGGDLFSFAGWASGLGGLDCSRCRSLALRIRGAKGGERPHVYLDDGNHRWPVDLGQLVPVTTRWQDVSIPLEQYAKAGVDLSHLVELQVVFEWQPASGTVYLDDVELITEPDAGREQLADSAAAGDAR